VIEGPWDYLAQTGLFLRRLGSEGRNFCQTSELTQAIWDGSECRLAPRGWYGRLSYQ